MQPRHALPFLQPGRLARVLTSTESVPSGPDHTDTTHEVNLCLCHCPSASQRVVCSWCVQFLSPASGQSDIR